MVSSFTTNKHIEQPANGDDVGTWDVPVNADWAIIDKALGGQTNLNATGASGTTVLSIAQYQPLIINITGVLTANLIYQIPSGVGGQWIVNNATTGAFTVTFSSGGAGLTSIVTQGLISGIYSDGTNIRGSNTAGSVPNNSITNSKLAQMPANTLKGNNTNAAANAADITPSQALDIISSVQGSLLYRDASGWLALAPGAAGTALQSQGAGANPVWGGSVAWAPGSLSGLTLSATSLSIGVATGACRNENSGVFTNMTLAGAISKTLSAWAVGSGSGGLFSGSIAANTWYHFYLIQNTTSGVVDAGFEINYPPSNVPATYNAYRRLGSVLTNASSQIVPFSQLGDEFLWITPVPDSNVVGPSASAVLVTLTVPTGLQLDAVFQGAGFNGSGTWSYYISSPDVADLAPQTKTTTAITLPASGDVGTSGAAFWQYRYHRVRTSTTAQVRTRTTGAAAADRLAIITYGWFDTRGS